MARFENPPYYLTAYGLAVKRGYKGTLDEWLASLQGEKGDGVELRNQDGMIQWRRVPAAALTEEEWVDLIDLSAAGGAGGEAGATVEEVLEQLPVKVSEDGYTEISGLRQVVSGKVVRDGQTITVTTVLEGNETHTDVITLDDADYPVKIVSDGREIPWGWEGF